MKRYLCCLALLGVHFLAFSQDWDEEGEIRDAEVVIEKDKVIELPFANRNYEKIPPFPFQQQKNKLTYRFKSFEPILPRHNPRVRVLKVAVDPPEDYFGNYAKAGFGNFVTPYAELFLHNKRNENYAVGFHGKHLSSRNGPVDGENSGNSETLLNAFGQVFRGDITLSGDVAYKRNGLRFFGYDQSLEVLEDTIRQSYDQVSVDLGLSKFNSEDPFNGSLNIGINNLNDDFQASEFQFYANGRASYRVNDTFSGAFDIDFVTINQDDSLISNSRTIFSVNPQLIYRSGNLTVSGGVTIATQNDTLANGNGVRIFPDAKVTYQLSKSLQVFGGLGGGIEKVALQTLLDENQFLQSQLPIFNTINRIKFFGGIRGSLPGNLSYQTGFAFDRFRNLFFFVNDPSDSTRFIPIYDIDNTNRINVYGELIWQKNSLFQSSLRFDVYGYSTSLVDEAFHRPNFTLNWQNTLNLYDKIRLNADVYIITGLDALAPVTDETVSLDNIVDISIKGEYLFSKAFSAFISVDNLLSQDYERFLNYPSRSIQVIAGIGFSF